MFVSVLARKLKPGKTYEDFIAAWYPDKGFGVPCQGPILARSLSDPNEILAIALIDIPLSEVDVTMRRIAAQEAVRHDRTMDVIDSTSFRGLFEVADQFDFSTDASVAKANRVVSKRGLSAAGTARRGVSFQSLGDCP